MRNIKYINKILSYKIKLKYRLLKFGSWNTYLYFNHIKYTKKKMFFKLYINVCNCTTKHKEI